MFLALGRKRDKGGGKEKVIGAARKGAASDRKERTLLSLHTRYAGISVYR